MSTEFDEKQYEMIFGLHEDGVNQTFGEDVFDLSIVHSNEIRTLDSSLLGAVRRHASSVESFVPLVTYGVTVKKMPELHSDYSHLMNLGSMQNAAEPRIAVYKQRKVDNNLKEYFVLSIGISGEVFKGDLISCLVSPMELMNKNIVDLNTVLQNASYRNYYDKVDTCMVDQEQFHNYVTAGLCTPFTFLRDMRKKPGYSGCAHIGAVYMISMSLENEMSYTDTNYLHMGWFTLEELRTVIAAQEGRRECPAIPESFGFANPGLQEKLGQLVMVDFEPWSEKLIFDSTGEFEHLLQFAPGSDSF